MTYSELKNCCDKKIEDYPDLQKKYKREIILAKRFYSNNLELDKYLTDNIDKIDNRYVIPFLLGLTSEVSNEDFKYKFFKEGSSGGIDIDSDFDPVGKEKIYQYLISKFGEERVLHVGTFSKLGPASAAKDLLRIYKIDFVKSNEFTKQLDHRLNWEDNLKNIKEKFPFAYKFYEENKAILDLTPHFIEKIRQSGKHAGGIIILDEPVWKRIPVERVTGEIVSAFPESAQEQVLDEVGVVKFDILAITILDVIRNSVKMIGEKLFLIEEDGIQKIVSNSYLVGKEIDDARVG